MSKNSTYSVRKWKLKNPVRYSWQSHKDNAKRRNIEFDLTFDQFKEFCEEVDLLTKKGKHKRSYTIDRIDNTKGYTIGNIQKLTRKENSSKGTKVLIYDFYSKTAYYSKINLDKQVHDQF